MGNPAHTLLQTFLAYDFAVLAHGWAPHGRDYLFYIQDCLGADPGEHVWRFTHCVRADCETRVGDDVWPKAWTDDFIDFERWQASGEPSGYVWGTNWSNAYPGLTILDSSPVADEWTERVGKPFYECALETDRFFIRLVYHHIQTRKLNDNIGTIKAVTIPLGP